ncbi:MAG: hypothetical protein ACRD1O_05215 [Terriglobia bacterium]
MNPSETGLARPHDFAAFRDSAAKAQRVTLPKLGKAVLLRRPSPLWFVFHQCLPQTLAAEIVGASQEPVRTAEDVAKLADWITTLLSEVMVEPRVSLHPGPEEISPDIIADEDLNFLLRWSMGEVMTEDGNSSSVSDLAPFRGERSSPASESGSSHLGLPPQ